MKLRNKKTGEIKSIEEIIRDAFLSNELDSLKSIDTNWEDVDVTNATNIPLIKDEKIRKAVRAWAEASGITKVLSYGDCFWIGFRSVKTESVWKFECSYSDAFEFELDKEYTIAELCGEEEE